MVELVTFRLDDLEQIESTELRVGSSSRRDACGVATGVDTDPGADTLLSERPWVDRLGGGGGFLDACDGGGVAVVGLGEVGGRAV